MNNHAIKIDENTAHDIPLGYMQKSQAPLREAYVKNPEAAHVIDWAKTSCEHIPANYPLGTQLTVDALNPTEVIIGVHNAVGGRSDMPTPGDMLCGALASCLDSTLRVISNLIGVQLIELSVEVKGHVDVRGTLMMNTEVPVRFQRFEITVTLKTKKEIGASNKKALIKAAENSCIVLQTIKEGGADIDLQIC